MHNIGIGQTVLGIKKALVKSIMTRTPMSPAATSTSTMLMVAERERKTVKTTCPASINAMIISMTAVLRSHSRKVTKPVGKSIAEF